MHLRNTLVLAALLAFLTAPAAALAGELYIGGSLGAQTLLSIDDSAEDDIDRAGPLIGFSSKYFADPGTLVETGQVGIGFDYFYANHDDYSYDGFVFDALYDFEMSKGVSFYATAGLGYWETDSDFDNRDRLKNDDGLLLAGGIGGLYAFRELQGFTVGGEVRLITLPFTDNVPSNVLLQTSVQIGWTFDLTQYIQ